MTYNLDKAIIFGGGKIMQKTTAKRVLSLLLTLLLSVGVFAAAVTAGEIAHPVTAYAATYSNELGTATTTVTIAQETTMIGTDTVWVNRLWERKFLATASAASNGVTSTPGITWSLASQPSGMTIDASGKVSFKPVAADYPDPIQYVPFTVIATATANGVTATDRDHMLLTVRNALASGSGGGSGGGIGTSDPATAALINNLKTLIAKARELRNETRISEKGDGSDVPKNIMWVTEEVDNTFLGDIYAAQSAKYADSPQITQALIDLQAVMDTFSKARQNGTLAVTVDLSRLKAALDTADELESKVWLSEDGTDIPDDYDYWLPKAAYKAFYEVWDTAYDVYDHANTQAEVDQALANLNAAILAFKQAAGIPVSSGNGGNSGGGSGGHSSSGGYSSGGSGGGGAGASASPAGASANVTGNGSVSQAIVSSQAAQALSGAGDSATVTAKNALTISPAALNALARQAAQAGKDLTLRADSTNALGAIEARLYLDVAQLAGRKTGLQLGVHTSGPAVEAAKKALLARFDNPNMGVVVCDQKGSFGTQMKMAAKVDLSKMDTKNLQFYSYDRATGKIVEIKTEYRIDSNGFVHFSTPVGGNIIITDNPLQAIR